MTYSGEIISELLSHYLWEDSNPIDRAKIEALSLSEWEDIHKLALRQGVSGMVLDAIVAAQISIPFAVKMRFITSTDNIEKRYEDKVKAISKLENIYSQNGIKLMVLKGAGLAQLYPVPNHRPCSDVDIWLFGKQVEADNILRQQYNISINEGHHHHTVFYIDGVMVENHYDFIEQHSRRSKRIIERYLKELFERESPIETQIEGTNVYTPSPNFNALFLTMHSGAHFAAETIPLRHLTDWAMFLKRYHNDIDWQSLTKLGEQFGFTPFLQCLNSACCSYLGMPKEYAHGVTAESDIVAKAIDDILEYRRINIPENFIKGWIFRIKRRFRNSWKQKMVYKDSQFIAFILSFLTHIIHPNWWKKE